MRWDDLFEDMEAQLAAMTRSELDARVEDLTRAEHAGVALASRLRASGGTAVTVALDDGTLVRGRVASAAEQWFELEEGVRRHLVPLQAVSWVQGVGSLAAPGPGVVERRLGLSSALRALARDRVRVLALTRAGAVAGRIARVGKDYLELDDAGPDGARTVGVGSADLGGWGHGGRRSSTTALPLERVLCVSEVV
ncbi:hypothetical protein [Luteimicrobium sp. DT211]|uniref:hypothetical protein n=1 Tax=Luteimicrobium sp. DT211 TaxID=3393412 RepID=UPI003CF3CF7D